MLRVGDLPTSKPLRQWLAGLGGETLQIALDPENAWQDPAGAAAVFLAADPAAVIEALAERVRATAAGSSPGRRRTVPPRRRSRRRSTS